MEETMVSPVFSNMLNFLALGLSLVLMFAVAYLWSSNNNKSAELERIQSELKRVKRIVEKLEGKISLMKEPTVVSDVPQIEPFGLDLTEPSARITPLKPQELWVSFVADFNKLAADMKNHGQLMRCEKFVREHKLRTLTYGGSMTFRPAIDVKDSAYWAFKCELDEYAIVPNPMNPCDEELYEHGGLSEIFDVEYQGDVYRKYIVKLPAMFEFNEANVWKMKKIGAIDLERK